MSSSEVKPEPKPEPVQPKSTFGQNKPATHSRDNSASNPKSPKVPLAVSLKSTFVVIVLRQ